MPATAVAAHPRAGHVMTGAEIIVQVLADEGVDTIFGYSGGAILPTYDAIFRYNDDQSQAADRRPAHAADRARERAGRGVHGGGLCARERQGRRLRRHLRARAPRTPSRPCAIAPPIRCPIVVICGQVGTAAIGSDAFQEAPVANIMGAVAKHCFLVTDATKLEATVRTAFEIARSGRPGPVVIDVPKDVQNWQGDFPGQRPTADSRLPATHGHAERVHAERRAGRARCWPCSPSANGR